MGNLKISKAKKNKNSRGSSGIPNWLLSTLVILVVVAVLATCIGTFVASSGITMRLSTAMSLDEYKVDGNMMAYFYGTTYMNFMNNYSSYLSYLSFDQNKDPKLQEFNPEGSYDAMFLQADSSVETWHDYFMSEAKKSVKNLLVYCAESKNLGVTLTEEDKLEIEASIESLLLEIRTSLGGGYPEYVSSLSDATCLANVYGNGISKTDVRKAMELSTLATKVAERIGDDIEGAITDDRINDTYNKNNLEFDLVDYFTYSISVYYDDVVAELYGDEFKAEDLDKAENADKKAAALELYTKKIREAHTAAEELKGKTTLDDFRNWVIDYATKNAYDEQFKTAMKDITDEQKPAKKEGATEEPLEIIKDKTIAAVIKEVTEGKETVTDDVVSTEADSTTTYTLYDITLSKEFAEAAKTLKSKLFDVALSAKEDGLKDKSNYYEDDDFSKWAFDKTRTANETANFESGDGCNSAEVTVSAEKFTADISFLIKPIYRDETLSRNLVYMLFTKEENAKKAIEALEATEGLDKDKFLALATDENNPADAYSSLDDCVVGTMQEDAFDEWLFSATAGEFTKTPITMSDKSLMVAMYLSEGTMSAWKYNVKSHIYNEDYAAYEEKMNTDFGSSVVINEKVLNKVGA